MREFACDSCETFGRCFPRMTTLSDLINTVTMETKLDRRVFRDFASNKDREVKGSTVDDVRGLLDDFAQAKANLVCGGGDR